MTALAIREELLPEIQVNDDYRFLAVIERAWVTLQQATDTSLLQSVVTELDSVRRALAAFDVSETLLREADTVFVHSLEALGQALREQYQYINPAIKGSGIKPGIVRAAMAIAAPKVGSKRLLDVLAERGLRAALTTVQFWATHIDYKIIEVAPENAPVEKPVFTPNVAEVQRSQDRVLDSLRLTLAWARKTPLQSSDLRKLRSIRASASVLIESIDLTLKDKLSAAILLLKGDD